MTNTPTTSDIIGTASLDWENLVAWVEPHAKQLDAQLDKYAENPSDKLRVQIKQGLHAYIT
jgi:hypothetical protein